MEIKWIKVIRGLSALCKGDHWLTLGTLAYSILHNYGTKKLADLLVLVWWHASSADFVLILEADGVYF